MVVALISAGGSVALSTTALFLMLNTNLNKLTSRMDALTVRLNRIFEDHAGESRHWRGSALRYSLGALTRIVSPLGRLPKSYRRSACP